MSTSQRFAFSFLRDGFKFRMGRLYDTFWYSQSNLKWVLVFGYPALLFWVRWRADHQYKYRIYVADSKVTPDTTKKVPLWGKEYGQWSNGKPVYQQATATVQDLKAAVYGGKDKVPESVRAGCHGRMFEDSDNLALAVRSFCKRDPMIVFWDEVTAQKEVVGVAAGGQ